MDNQEYTQDRTGASGHRDIVHLSAAYAEKMRSGGSLPFAGRLLWLDCDGTGLRAGRVRMEASRTGEETWMDLQFLGEARTEADMDALALEIIRAAGKEASGRVLSLQEEAAGVEILKTKLKTDAGDMAAVFTEIGIDFPEDLSQEIWTVLLLSGGGLNISYAAVNEGYVRSMKTQVSGFLKDIAAFSAGEEQRGGPEEKAPVFLIGDIYRFYPLWLQIQDTFPEVEAPKGFYDDNGESMKEDGIKLLENGTVRMRMIAPWDVGLNLVNELGLEAPLWAFSEGDRVLPGEIRFLQGTDRDRTVPAPVWFKNGVPDRIVLRSAQLGEKTVSAAEGPFAGEENGETILTVGFSFDTEGRMFLHLRKFDLMKGTAGEEERKLGPLNTGIQMKTGS